LHPAQPREPHLADVPRGHLSRVDANFSRSIEIRHKDWFDLLVCFLSSNIVKLNLHQGL
jgi:hypothetical protein